MSETLRGVFAKFGSGDVYWGDSTTTFSYSRMATAGGSVTVSDNYVDSAVIPLSEAAKTTLGLTGDKDLDDAWAGLAAGTSLNKAGTPTLGVTSLSTAPALATLPVAVGDNDTRMLASAANATALNNALAAVTVTGVANLAKAPSSSLPIATANHIRDEHAGKWGTGKDGAYTVGAITDPATAPSGLSTSTTGGAISNATYSYKITFGNHSGETLPSSASSTQVTTGATSTITMTIPVGGSNTAWRKLYRDNGGGTWYLVGYIPDNTTTTFVDRLQYPGSTAAPGSNTTGASWDTPSGEYHFDGDTTIGATTFTGDVVIRVRGKLTISGAWVGTGAGGGKSVLTPFSSTQTGTTAVFHLYPTTGFGTQYQAAQYPGAGSAGQIYSSGTAGTAGLPGAVIVVYAHEIRVGADITSNGAAGGNASAAGASAGGGGGGAGGIVWLVARDAITSGTHTVTTNGGNGGDGAGSGGANKAWGGRAGGGGYLFASAPVLDIANLTHTKNAGSNGSDSTAATGGNSMGGGGGSCSGDGGSLFTYSGNTILAGTTATAGQTTSTTKFVQRGIA